MDNSVIVAVLSVVCTLLGSGLWVIAYSRLTDYRLVRSSNAKSGIWFTVSYHVNGRCK